MSDKSTVFTYMFWRTIFSMQNVNNLKINDYISADKWMNRKMVTETKILYVVSFILINPVEKVCLGVKIYGITS